MFDFDFGTIVIYQSVLENIDLSLISDILIAHAAGDCRILDAEILGYEDVKGDFGYLFQSLYCTEDGTEVIVSTFTHDERTLIYLRSDFE